MFELSNLKQTRVYQEGREEGKEEGREEGREEGAHQEKLRMIPLLVKLGLSLEEVAKELCLSVEEVQQQMHK